MTYISIFSGYCQVETLRWMVYGPDWDEICHLREIWSYIGVILSQYWTRIGDIESLSLDMELFGCQMDDTGYLDVMLERGMLQMRGDAT